MSAKIPPQPPGFLSGLSIFWLIAICFRPIICFFNQAHPNKASNTHHMCILKNQLCVPGAVLVLFFEGVRSFSLARFRYEVCSKVIFSRYTVAHGWIITLRVGAAASRTAETRTYHRNAQSHFERPTIWKSYGEVKSPRYCCFSLFHSAFRTLGVELFLAYDNSACSRMTL
jgi:hypothetical protein